MKKKLITTRILIITAVILTILILTGALIFVYHYTATLNRNLASRENELHTYTDAIKSELRVQNESLVSVCMFALNSRDADSRNALTQSNFRRTIHQYMSSVLSSGSTLDALAVKNADSTVSCSSSAQYFSQPEMYLFFKSASLEPNSSASSTAWELCYIGGKPYFYQAYRVSGALICSLASLDKLMTHPDVSDRISAVLCLSGNDVISAAGTVPVDTCTFVSEEDGLQPKNGYRLISTEITGTKLRICFVLAQSDLSALDTSGTMLLLQLFLVTAVVLLVMLWYELHIGIQKPAKELLAAMKDYQSGDLDKRIYADFSNQEFSGLAYGFNSMAEEVQNLKITQYEMKMHHQLMQLRQLQSQIKTHFYLNAFNTVQSMTYRNSNEMIRKYLQALSQHMRYMMRIDLEFVPLTQEISHIANFFEMQNIKFPNSVSLSIAMPESLAGRPVPYLTVYTAAENTIKHAMTLESTLTVCILCSVDNDSSLIVRIEDNGAGFSSESLSKLREDADEHDMHFGLKNVRETLRLLYHRDNLLRLGNRPEGGAFVEICIPNSTHQEDRGSSCGKSMC